MGRALDKGVYYMRLCRFDNGRLGIVDGDNLRDVTAALDVLPVYRYPLPPCDPADSKSAGRCRPHPHVLPATRRRLPLSGVTLLSPVANPGKVIAAPVNYQKHLDEVRGDEDLHHQNPINTIHKAGLFLKATSALAGPGEGIALRKLERRNDHEIELVFVIGKTARNVPKDEALDYVAGYSIGLDITIRGPGGAEPSQVGGQLRDPRAVAGDGGRDPRTRRARPELVGQRRDPSAVEHQEPDSRRARAHRAGLVVLHAHPGDVFFTGTPEGVSPIEPGDSIHASIERIGSMDVKVRAA